MSMNLENLIHTVYLLGKFLPKTKATTILCDEFGSLADDVRHEMANTRNHYAKTLSDLETAKAEIQDLRSVEPKPNKIHSIQLRPLPEGERQHDKIKAIREIREVFRCTLADAKRITDILFSAAPISLCVYVSSTRPEHLGITNGQVTKDTIVVTSYTTMPLQQS